MSVLDGALGGFGLGVGFRAIVLGLSADLPRKNCWTIAEHAGEATLDGMQYTGAAACGRLKRQGPAHAPLAAAGRLQKGVPRR
ncbi:MAG: hypothetical protein ACRDS0_24320 [Pseudonocardiaceae bacterium]